MKAKTNTVLMVVALLAYWVGLCNCLYYALDRPGKDLQPDGESGGKNGKNCKDLVTQIKKNYGSTDVPSGGTCPTGFHKIALSADGDGGYHVQRQDSDGGWSEMSLNPTYPPRKCTKGKAPGKPCGELCAPDQPKSISPSLLQ